MPAGEKQMSEITIVKEDDGRRGRYVATVAGIAAEAELTFTHRGPGQISADHTGAPDALKGTGVAAALADHLVADARASGFKIIPLCPYVRARYEKHPDWQDVMTVAPGEMPRISLKDRR
jgi:predicted GNAT family acetyltransferase